MPIGTNVDFWSALSCRLGLSTAENGNFRKLPLLDRSQASRIYHLFALWTALRQLNLTWGVRRPVQGPSREICADYLLAVWTTAQALSMPFAAINLAIPVASENSVHLTRRQRRIRT
jgi:hypothetical protein